MNSKHSAKTQQTVIDRIMKENVPVGMIVEETSIPRSTIYYWVKRHNDRINRKNNEISLKSYRLLENKVARLEGIIKILKTVECTVKDPLEIKLSELEKLHGKYNVHMLCEALDVSRGSFYNHILRNKRENTWYVQRRTELRDKIQQVYDDNYQIFGATKICAVMKEEGYHVSVEMVRELMRDMGLISVRKGAKGLYEKEKRSFSNHINKQFTASAPNQVWVSDVTCYKLNDKTFYICVIIDLYARFVVGYKISKNCSTHLTKGTFRKAYENRNTPSGLIFHSDRGGNYIAKNLEQKGYEIKAGKDISVRPQGKERFVRLMRNYGEDYSIENIRNRILLQSIIPKHLPLPEKKVRSCKVKGNIRTTRKATGFRALYLYYCYKLGIFPKGKPQNPKRVHFLLREDLLKLNNISQEVKLLVRNRIDTAKQLSSYKDDLERRIKRLSAERKALYKKQRTVSVRNDPDAILHLKENIEGINKELKSLRYEVHLCDDIAVRSGIITEKLKTIREDKSQGKEISSNEQLRRGG